MITLLFILLFIILAVKFKPLFKTYETKIYALAILLATLSLIFNDFPITTPIIQGFMGLALFYLVMIASSLKPKSSLRKNLIGLRKQYSIIGFILITPHAFYYLHDFIFNNGTFTPFGIIAYLIMIPLFITSFMKIRKKMKPKSWRNLQRFAYLSYGFLLIHLILHYTQLINLIAYLVLASIYMTLKVKAKLYPLIKAYAMQLKKQA